jgi:predicted AAA+ superfamily ATPase
MHPFTERELGTDFSLERALKFGLLPEIWDGAPPQEYLESYVTTYLKEEIQHEGLTRNLGSFSRFLEIASLSQASPLNVTNVARESSVDAKTAENYFTILEDLLLAQRVPVFSKHAKRELYQRPKFFFFDVGVYRIIRPKGPLDTPEHIDGAALETLLFQQLFAYNHYYKLGFQFFYWRTHSKLGVDLVLYGERGLFAFEVKRSRTINKNDLKGLTIFLTDYPVAKGFILYGGTVRQYFGNIEAVPYEEALPYFLKLIGV